jgi:hypothetical protein
MSVALSATVAELLDEWQVPLPTAAVRILASLRRGDEVAAEALSRLAAAQRDEFLRANVPPRLCHAIAEDGRPLLSPRVWASGQWRLARRIATPDALPGWQVALAAGLCQEMLRLGSAAPQSLGRLTLEALARVLGPVASYLPGDAQEWEQLRRRVLTTVPLGAGPANHTLGQAAAEDALIARGLPAVNLYFGISDVAAIEQPLRDPAHVRLPVAHEEGIAFEEVLRRRTGGRPERLRELRAYLQGYAALSEQLGRAPSPQELAGQARITVGQVRQDEQLFHAAFPEEQDPQRLLALLSRALPRSPSFARVVAARVVDGSPRASGVLPAPGQRWTRPDGTAMTIIEADREQLTVGLHQHGTTSLSVIPRDGLAGWTLELPREVWMVRFDVGVVPATLIEPLHQAGIVCDRLARPGDPRPGQPALAVGTIEAHLSAADESEAREKVLNALRGRVAILPEDVHVTRPAPGAIID